METLTIKSHQRNEMIDVTADIQQILKKKNIQSGFVIVYVPHTTAAVTINEGADPDVQRDIISTLGQLIPEHGTYHHSEGNSDAHIKASLLGSSETIVINEGSLVLGTWQHVFFYEGDGPRTRKIYLEFFKQ